MAFSAFARAPLAFTRLVFLFSSSLSSSSSLPPPFHHPHYKFSYSLLFILSFAASPALELTIRLFACIPNKSIFCIESCLYSLKMHFIVTCCNFYCVRIIVAMYIFAIYIIFGMCGSMLHRILHRWCVLLCFCFLLFI